MAASTLTYADNLNGWTSFFSYLPEWMIGMNNTFYSFKAGHLYKHRDDTVTKNYFYGVQYNSTIKTIFNDAPLDAKMFKTIGLESNSAWTAAITTDFGSGSIDASYFQLKEGDYYGYIRRIAGNIDLDLMSAQGIGEVTTVTTSVKDSGTTDAVPVAANQLKQTGQNFLTTVSVGDTVNNTTSGTSAIVTSVDSDILLTLDCNIMAAGTQAYTINATTLLFAFSLDNIVSVGDTVYFGATPTLGGTITAIDDKTLTISLTSDGSCGTISGAAPNNGDYILYFKDAVAESYGARGYYMQIELTNTATTAVELFAITSEVFKSYP
jgi:preprotein translocase subunit YajC